MADLNDLYLKEKTVTQKGTRGYRVYSDKNNFKLVEADTAFEAIQKSGVVSPHKVEAVNIVTKSVFSPQEIAERSIAQPADAPPAQ